MSEEHQRPTRGPVEPTLGLTERTLTALKWNCVGVGTKAAAQFIVGVALARLLGPEPFGVYSVMLLVTGVGSLLVERGYGSAIIQTSNPSDETIRIVFTRMLLTGTAAAAMLCLAARSLTVLATYPALRTAIYASALYLFVYGASVVPSALLSRELDMRSIQIGQVSAYLIGYIIVGMGGALLGIGAWSLAGALTSQLIIYGLFAYSRVPHTLRPLFRPKNRHLTTFGNLVLATNLLNWMIENVDNLIVGRTFGMHSLGLYSVSYNLVRTPTNHLMATVQAVLFPAAARAQDNVQGHQKAYVTALSAVLFVLCPLFFGVAAVASTVVEGIYGDKWAGAESVLFPLALAMPVHGAMTGSALLWARGQVATELRVQAGIVVIFIGALLIASQISTQAVAWAVFGVYLLRAFWLTSRILKSIHLPWKAFGDAVRAGVLLGIVTAATFYLLDARLAFAGLRPFNRLSLLAVVGVAIVTILPIYVRKLIPSPEFRDVLERAIPTSPRLVRAVMQLYART